MKKPFIDREKIHKWMKRTTLVSAVLFIIAELLSVPDALSSDRDAQGEGAEA